MAQILIADRNYVPRLGDVHIENPSAPLECRVIDPQHGGHRPPDYPDAQSAWPAVTPDDAACTYAARLAREQVILALSAPLRVVLLPRAGLDDFCAAAVLTHPDCLRGDASTRRIAGVRSPMRAEEMMR